MTQAAPLRRIVLAGWYGRDNAGDEAILRQFLHELPPSPSLHLTILAHDRVRLHAQLAGPDVAVLQHYRFHGREGLMHLLRGRHRPVLDALRRCDAFVVGGGSLIHDNSGLHSLLPVVDDMLAAQHYGRPVWLYSVGVGPLRGRLARRIAGHALRRCARLTVRDATSRDLLLSLGVDPARITLVADPVFLVQPEAPPASVLARLAAQGPLGARVGVFLKHALGLGPAAMQRLVAWLAHELAAVHARHGLRFTLLPMMTHPEDDDRRIAHAVRAALADPSIVDVEGGMLPPEQLAWLSREFRFDIAMRLHGAIFALGGGVPTVAIDYDPKVGALMRGLDQADLLVGMRPPEDGTLAAAVDRLIADEARQRAALESRLPGLREQAGQFFDLFRASLR